MVEAASVDKQVRRKDTHEEGRKEGGKGSIVRLIPLNLHLGVQEHENTLVSEVYVRVDTRDIRSRERLRRAILATAGGGGGGRSSLSESV